MFQLASGLVWLRVGCFALHLHCAAPDGAVFPWRVNNKCCVCERRLAQPRRRTRAPWRGGVTLVKIMPAPPAAGEGVIVLENAAGRRILFVSFFSNHSGEAISSPRCFYGLGRGALSSLGGRPIVSA